MTLTVNGRKYKYVKQITEYGSYGLEMMENDEIGPNSGGPQPQGLAQKVPAQSLHRQARPWSAGDGKHGSVRPWMPSQAHRRHLNVW